MSWSSQVDVELDASVHRKCPKCGKDVYVNCRLFFHDMNCTFANDNRLEYGDGLGAAEPAGEIADIRCQECEWSQEYPIKEPKGFVDIFPEAKPLPRIEDVPDVCPECSSPVIACIIALAYCYVDKDDGRNDYEFITIANPSDIQQIQSIGCSSATCKWQLKGYEYDNKEDVTQELRQRGLLRNERDDAGNSFADVL